MRRFNRRSTRSGKSLPTRINKRILRAFKKRRQAISPLTENKRPQTCRPSSRGTPRRNRQSLAKDFWKLIRSPRRRSKYGVELAAYLRKRYGVELELLAAVWKEMVNRPHQRQYLFQLLVSTPRSWLVSANVPPSEDIKKFLKFF